MTVPGQFEGGFLVQGMEEGPRGSEGWAAHERRSEKIGEKSSASQHPQRRLNGPAATIRLSKTAGWLHCCDANRYVAIVETLMEMQNGFDIPGCENQHLIPQPETTT